MQLNLLFHFWRYLKSAVLPKTEPKAEAEACRESLVIRVSDCRSAMTPMDHCPPPPPPAPNTHTLPLLLFFIKQRKVK